MTGVQTCALPICCAASYAQLSGGGEYICVTGNAFSSWRCIKDHVQLYTTYLPGLEPVLE